ncbi:MAG: DUF1320 family protein [Verrucomicrobia bacterium]|nr:DUF1320 family protein [Verrucomicrobiota bacterium]
MSESWSTLTTVEVLEEFTPQEAATLNNIQGATNTLANIITRVTDQVRDVYTSGGRPLEGVGIPDGVKSRAISIVRWRLLTSFPQMKHMQTEERKSAYDSAQDWLTKIANRDIIGSGSAVLVSTPERRASRERTDGLM